MGPSRDNAVISQTRKFEIITAHRALSASQSRYKYQVKFGEKSPGFNTYLITPALLLLQRHPLTNPLSSMDSFTAITTFFSTVAAKAEDATMEQPPTNEEGSGSGGGAYCVVA